MIGSRLVNDVVTARPGSQVPAFNITSQSILPESSTEKKIFGGTEVPRNNGVSGKPISA
jgi:hypothetical protein